MNNFHSLQFIITSINRRAQTILKFCVSISTDVKCASKCKFNRWSWSLNVCYSFLRLSSFEYSYSKRNSMSKSWCDFLKMWFINNYLFSVRQLQAASAGKELDAYAKAASIVEEALSGIRTVLAFGGEKVEVDRYTTLLDPARRAAIRKGLFSSISDSVTRFLFFASSALSFWIGVQWVLSDRDKTDKEYTPASLLIVSWLMYLESTWI